MADGWDELEQATRDALLGRAVNPYAVLAAFSRISRSADFDLQRRERVAALDAGTREAILALGRHPLTNEALTDETVLDHREWHWLKRVSLDGWLPAGGPAAYLREARRVLSRPSRAYAVLGSGGDTVYVQEGLGGGALLAVLDLRRKYIRSLYPPDPGRGALEMAKAEHRRGKSVVELVPRIRAGKP